MNGESDVDFVFIIMLPIVIDNKEKIKSEVIPKYFSASYRQKDVSRPPRLTFPAEFERVLAKPCGVARTSLGLGEFAALAQA